MNLLADEGVERQIIERLRQDDHKVVYIAELEPGIGDNVILRRANATQALLITADKDFGELVFRQRLVPQQCDFEEFASSDANGGHLRMPDSSPLIFRLSRY